MTGYLTISSIGPPGISLFTAHTVYIITTPNWSHVGAFLFLSVCMCERSTMGRGQQNQRISTVERKLRKREQKTKGLVYWFKHWLIDLQVTVNVKGPSHRTSLPPSYPPTQPSSLCCPACLCQCSQKNLSPFPSLFCSVSFPTITPLSCPLHPFSWNSWFHHRTGLISPTL